MPSGKKSRVWYIQRKRPAIPERIVLDQPYYKRGAVSEILRLKGWDRRPVGIDIYMPYDKEDRDGTKSSD